MGRMTRSTGLLLAFIWLTALICSTSATDARGEIGPGGYVNNKKDYAERQGVQRVTYLEKHLDELGSAARMVKLDCEYRSGVERTDCYKNPNPHDTGKWNRGNVHACPGYDDDAKEIYKALAVKYRDANCKMRTLSLGTNRSGCTWTKIT